MSRIFLFVIFMSLSSLTFADGTYYGQDDDIESGWVPAN